METIRSAMWTVVFAIVSCSAIGSTELAPSSASWSAAAAVVAQSAMTADSATHRGQEPPEEQTAAASASSAGRGTVRRSAGDPAASPAGRHVSGRPPVMLVNRDDRPHSLAPSRPGRSAGSEPAAGLTEEAAGGTPRRRPRSLLPPPSTAGAGQVLVALARGPVAPLIPPPSPRLTASAFLVQFSEMDGWTSQPVEMRGTAADGEGTVGERHVTPGRAQNQGHGQEQPIRYQEQGQEQRQRKYQAQGMRHGPGQAVTRTPSPDPDGQRYQPGAADGPRGAGIPYHTGATDGPRGAGIPGRYQTGAADGPRGAGIPYQPGAADGPRGASIPYQTGAAGGPQGAGIPGRYQPGAADGPRRAGASQSRRPAEAGGIRAGLRPEQAAAAGGLGIPRAGPCPTRPGYDQRPTAQQAASSVTVTASVRPQPDQRRQNQYGTQGQAVGYKYRTQGQPTGYKFEAQDQSTGYNYETSNQLQTYDNEIPEQAQGYNYKSRDQTQKSNFNAPDQQRGYTYKAPDQALEYNYQTADQNHDYDYDYEAPNQHQGYDYEALDQPQITPTNSQTVHSSRTELTGVVAPAARPPGSAGAGSRTRASLSGGDPAAAAAGGQFSGHGGSRPAARAMPNNPSTRVSDELAPDANIRPSWGGGGGGGGGEPASSEWRPRPEVTGHRPPARPVGGAGWRSGPPAAIQTVSVNTADPAELSDIPPEIGDGRAGSETGYRYDPPASTDNGQPHSSSGTETGYRYDPRSSVGSRQVNAPSDANTGYNYDPSQGVDSEYQYAQQSGADDNYQYNQTSVSNTEYQNGVPADTDAGYQYRPPSITDTGHQYDPPAAGGGSGTGTQATTPAYHIDPWRRPQSAPSPTPSLAGVTQASGANGWQPMAEHSAAVTPSSHPGWAGAAQDQSTARPQLSSGALGPSTARPQPAPSDLSQSTARPQPADSDLSPSSAGPEFPPVRLEASPSPRGLMWPVLDVLERTMDARMVSSFTVGDPDGVVVRHRGTAYPRRRRRRAGRPAADDMKHALAMVAALSPGKSGRAVAAPSVVSPGETGAPLSQLPLEPSPALWPPPREEHQPTAATPVSAETGSESEVAADRQRQGRYGVLPAPLAMTYPDLRSQHRQPGVSMELDQTADGAALWAADQAPAGHTDTLLDQFPLEPSGTGNGSSEAQDKPRKEAGKLAFDDVHSAFGGGFFDSLPDEPFPLGDIVIPDFYFVDEFDTKANLIESAGSIETKSVKPNGLVLF